MDALFAQNPRSRWRDRSIVALLLAAAFLPYARTLAFRFVYDDLPVIRENVTLRGWHSLLAVWTTEYNVSTSGLYRPVLMSIFAIVWNVGGHAPVWFHLLAVAAHMSATLLVWLLLRRGVDGWAAALAALWFAVL